MLAAEWGSPDDDQSSLGRLQDLQVLKSIPQAEEKRSHFVVSGFLLMEPAHDYQPVS